MSVSCTLASRFAGNGAASDRVATCAWAGCRVVEHRMGSIKTHTGETRTARAAKLASISDTSEPEVRATLLPKDDYMTEGVCEDIPPRFEFDQHGPYTLRRAVFLLISGGTLGHHGLPSDTYFNGTRL